MTSIPIAGYTYSAPLKGQPGYGIVQNPTFDSRILNIPMRQISAGDVSKLAPNTSELFRGTMVSKYKRDGNQYRVNFLYNPSTINESRTIDLDNQIFPDSARVPGDPGTYKTALNTTINFSLLFDRTYELWDSKYQQTDAGKFGVLVDINAFYNLTGINQKNTQAKPTGVVTSIVQGTMAAVPVNLYFGHKSVGALKYFGIISSMDITYTHFTQRMVPMRCAVNIGFTLYSDTPTTSS